MLHLGIAFGLLSLRGDGGDGPFARRTTYASKAGVMCYQKAWRVLLASLFVLMAALPLAAQETASPEITQLLTSWWRGLVGDWANSRQSDGSDLDASPAEFSSEGLESSTLEIQGCFPPGGIPFCSPDGVQGATRRAAADQDPDLGS